MARLLVGVALLPTAAMAMWAGVEALGRLSARSHSTWPFLAGLSATAAAWLIARLAAPQPRGAVGALGSAARLLHVLGHELTHAIAAWSVGAKVLGFKVTGRGGHVDLSHSNAFIALAPYCVPIYTLAVVGAYRLLLMLKPGTGGRALFLALMGVSVSFHLVKTFESLWDSEQPDLPAAGGVVFSLSWILLANGLVVLALSKALFPSAVELEWGLRSVATRTGWFWGSLYGVVEPLRRNFVAQLKRP